MGSGIDIPDARTIDRTVEHEGSHHIPVAIDILWGCGASTRLLVIFYLIADTVSGGREVDKRHDTLVMILHEVVVEQSEVLRKRRLQARVTLRDVQRVAVIHYIQQLRDAWLRGCTAIVDAQVAHLREAVTEIERRTEISDCADGIRMIAHIIVDEVGALWLNHHTEVEIILITDESHHHLDIVSIVLIFRILAQVIILGILPIVSYPVEIAAPGAVNRSDAIKGIIIKTVGAAITLGIAVSKLIAELQEGSLPERFTIGNLTRIAVILGRCQVITVDI